MIADCFTAIIIQQLLNLVINDDNFIYWIDDIVFMSILLIC